MHPDYQALRLPYVPSPDEASPEPAHHPVVIVGAGPVGLTLAIDLACRGVPALLLDDDDKLSAGSRAICFAKRTLEIWDRLGCGERITAKGVRWNVGKVFHRDDLVYRFDLLGEEGHRRPAFVNLQQYYVEGYLWEHAEATPGIEVRWRNKVVGLTQAAGRATLEVETPAGRHRLTADHVVAADGARSTVRALLGLESKGQTFRDRFLIADVRMRAAFPAERWFWFDPPFHPGQSVLLHRQPDDVWRIDFQLGWDADPVEERKPERVIPRVQALLGDSVQFDLVWCSVYTFACTRMPAFRHGRVLFTGDAAHGVSPFGARGANSGVQDADNLGWKLALVVAGKAPDRLLESYAAEREPAADENIRASTRATDFITPKNAASRLFREATLQLARDCPFARRLVNSGRLSVPTVLAGSPLSTPDADAFEGGILPGAPAIDAPIRVQGAEGWLLAELGLGFECVVFLGHGPPEPELGAELERLAALRHVERPLRTLIVVPAGAEGAGPKAIGLPGLVGHAVLVDHTGLAAARWDGRPGTTYLLRPDQHVAARWRRPDASKVEAALARAMGFSGATGLGGGTGFAGEGAVP
jgi:3-(3-hydroxy-phenyl)propionate hydroxylase